MKERFGRKIEYTEKKTAGCLRWAGRILAGAAVLPAVLLSGIGLPGVYGTSFGKIGTVYANAPVPRYEFEITIKNAPEGTWGVDFLVPKEKIPEEEYLELNEEALSEQNLPLDCELAVYEMDGAVSYSAHDKNGDFDSRLGEINGNLYLYGHRTGYNLVSKLGKETRLILFDEAGNVLAVSDLFKAYGSRPKSFNGEISFDAATGEVVSNGMVGGVTEEGKIDQNGGSVGGGSGSGIGDVLLGLLLFVGLLIGALLITIVLEMIIGLFFHLKPIWWVIPVNLITNIIFNLLLVVFCMFLGMNYYAYVAVGEIAVIAIEYVFYKQIYKEIDSKRILVYSIVANVISAGLGLLVTSGVIL